MGPEALVSILVGSSARLFATRVSIPSPPSAPDPGDGSSSSFMHSFLDTPSGLDHNNNNNNSGDGGVGGPRTEDLIAIANLLGLMVGLFTFLLGFFRLGFLDSVLSRPLLRGFVTAVAVVVCIDMGADLLRIKLPVSDEEESPISTLISILSRLSNTHALSAIISSISIAFILCCRYLKSIVAKQNSSPTTPTFLAIPKSAGTWIALFPEILFLVILSIILCWLCDWESLGVKILQSVEGGLIPPRLPPKITLVRIDSLFLSAVLISVVGFVESIVVTKTYASLHK